MGSSASKFQKHVMHGDEVAALQIYHQNLDFRKAFDPNEPFGDSRSILQSRNTTPTGDTAIHFAARHAMKSLLRCFFTLLI